MYVHALYMYEANPCVIVTQVQTKFTSITGQDPSNMPYDPRTSVTAQVHSSIKNSLKNLRLSDEHTTTEGTYIDILILHSPLPTAQETLEAWSTLETYVPHRIRNLGISNTSLPILKYLYDSPQVSIKPAVVQNRFYEGTQFDVPLREFNRQNQIIYQSFWTLTANPHLLRSDAVQQVASGAGISIAAALYCLVMGLGETTVLNGTTNEAHMQADLAAPAQIKQLLQTQPAFRTLWEDALSRFKRLIRG